MCCRIHLLFSVSSPALEAGVQLIAMRLSKLFPANKHIYYASSKLYIARQMLEALNFRPPCWGGKQMCLPREEGERKGGAEAGMAKPRYAIVH